MQLSPRLPLHSELKLEENFVGLACLAGVFLIAKLRLLTSRGPASGDLLLVLSRMQ